jgi:hypothetical protein
MKTYKGYCSRADTKVTVDSKPLSMKCFRTDTRNIPYVWGEQGQAGAVRLALSLIADAIDDKHAIHLAHKFASDVVSKLAPVWEITSDDIQDYSDFICAVGYAAQSDDWATASSDPSIVYLGRLSAPRILADPNYRLVRSAELFQTV